MENASRNDELAAEVAEIVSAFEKAEGPLLPILNAVQERFGYVPPDAIPQIAHLLNLTRAEVFGVVSFYHDYRDYPAGQHRLKLCRAEACQSMGGDALGARVKQLLGVDFGDTTADGAITLEPVYCLGLCATAPALMLDGKLHGRVTDKRVETLLAGCRT